MGFVQDFKEFALKGNVIDLAVGLIIGAAFGDIVKSLVNDVVMPPIGYVINGIDFSNLAYTMGTDAKGKPVEIKYGVFINNCLHFLIIALVIFVIIRQFNRLKRKPAELPPTMRACPFCTEQIAIKATKCPHCTADLPPVQDTPVTA